MVLCTFGCFLYFLFLMLGVCSLSMVEVVEARLSPAKSADTRLRSDMATFKELSDCLLSWGRQVEAMFKVGLNQQLLLAVHLLSVKVLGGG